jgi:putative oligomerization/nucleic acid binding protein
VRRQASALVTNVEEARTLLGRSRLRVTLSVQPDGEPEFEVVKTVKAEAEPALQLGARVSVAYDPGDRDDLELLESPLPPVTAAPEQPVVVGEAGLEQTLRQALEAKGVTGALQDEAVRKTLAAASAPAVGAGFEQTLRHALTAKGVTGELQDEAVGRALAAMASGSHVVDLTEYTRAHERQTSDPAERLELLAKLHAEGALSEAEFDAAKAKILAEE